MRSAVLRAASIAAVLVLVSGCSHVPGNNPKPHGQPTSGDQQKSLSGQTTPKEGKDDKAPKPLVETKSTVGDQTKSEEMEAVLADAVGGRTMEKRKRSLRGIGAGSVALLCMSAPSAKMGGGGGGYVPQQQFNTEAYDRIYENRFVRATDKPLSTFSIDVDAASYSNMRRFLTDDMLPPKDAVRIEEMINYFSYDYPQPKGDHPFSITAEMGACPWNSSHKLVHVGLQAKKVAIDSLPPSNLVFLLDVSGSMRSPNKLPLLKKAFTLLVKNLRKQDRVAVAVYAGAAGLVLPSTVGDKKETIINALQKLNAGGSTAGGAGIKLAYDVAKQNFLKNGNNRVILATDGDFNIGASSDGEMVRLIEEKRKDGIFLTVLGFGMGNYKDSKMEKLADKGNGNYAYIDNLLEAKKVLVSEMGGTLLTIAKDVKIQVEFNPSRVSAYRLIGYENRRLNNEDFNDDTKDAGELGAGHTVTALYEVIPVGVKAEEVPGVDPLKYQTRKQNRSASSRELLTVKFRYKAPDSEKSKLIVQSLEDKLVKKTSNNFRFSAAVAGFGMLLRDSEFKGNLDYSRVQALAKNARGTDSNGYRAELVRLIERAELIAESKS